MEELIKTLEEIKEHQMQTVQLARTTTVYKLADKAIHQALSIANVSQQRELLRSYNKFINEKCLLAGGILSDFEIEKFEERNSG